MTSKETYLANMNALADSINTKAGLTGKKTILELKEAVDNIELGVFPTGNIDITDTQTTNVTNYATARVVDSNLVGRNIKKDVVILGVTGVLEGGGGSDAFSITTHVTGGTASGATSTYPNATGRTTVAEVQITPDASHELPVTAEVTGASSSYNSSTGKITITDAVNDVVITTNCADIYSVTAVITDGVYVGSPTIVQYRSIQGQIMPNEGKDYPALLSVTNATVTSYDPYTGEFTISNPTGNVTITATCPNQDAVLSYLTFSSPNSFTLGINGTYGTYHWDGTVKYSTDSETWTNWYGETISSAVSGNDNVIYLAGSNNTEFGYENVHTTLVLTGSNISCSGEIESLLDHKQVSAGLHPTASTYAFAYLFSSCQALISAPNLSCPVVRDGQYYFMFLGCSNLTVAPALPATTVGSHSYYGMFQNCTALTTPPSILPAATLHDYSYYSMFQNCTALTYTPDISATSLAQYCCASMFEGCTNLVTIPATLTGTYLSTMSYYRMFKGCTSITTAPNFTAITPPEGEYDRIYGGFSEMYIGCTSLATPPNSIDISLLAKSENLCRDMFNGCTSLATVPELPSTTLYTGCYDSMFSQCIGLTSIASLSLSATTLAERCYQSMFQGCTNIVNVFERLPATTMVSSCYASMFSNCESLAATPIMQINVTANRCCALMFQICKSITTTRITLSDTSLADNCYDSMFRFCSALTTAPVVYATTLGKESCSMMFEACTNLTTIFPFPEATLGEGCYSDMFNACSNLETLPVLPTTTLAKDCYSSMFGSCTKIKMSTTQTGEYQTPYSIPSSGTGQMATGNDLYRMFYNTGGSSVGTEGTPTINTTYYTSNTLI